MKTPPTATLPTDCKDQPLLFQDLGPRKVVADFSGGTLLDFDPPDYKEFIKQQQEKVANRFGRGKSGSTAETTG